MSRFFRLWFGALVHIFCTPQNLVLENPVVRHQLKVLKRGHPRPRLDPIDKLFCVFARRLWSGWKRSLIVVTPETVVRWNRTAFRAYWRLISKARKRIGRRRVPKQIRGCLPITPSVGTSSSTYQVFSRDKVWKADSTNIQVRAISGVRSTQFLLASVISLRVETSRF